MSRVFALFLCACTALPTWAHASLSDVSCDDSARLAITLKEEWGAERQGIGLRDPDTILEVWVTDRDGEWVIVQTYANGTSCIVAMGEHWEGPVSNPA